MPHLAKIEFWHHRIRECELERERRRRDRETARAIQRRRGEIEPASGREHVPSWRDLARSGKVHAIVIAMLALFVLAALGLNPGPTPT